MKKLTNKAIFILLCGLIFASCDKERHTEFFEDVYTLDETNSTIIRYDRYKAVIHFECEKSEFYGSFSPEHLLYARTNSYCKDVVSRAYYHGENFWSDSENLSEVIGKEGIFFELEHNFIVANQFTLETGDKLSPEHGCAYGMPITVWYRQYK